MIRPAYDNIAPPTRVEPTIWGLSPALLHERFWASRGVQVVEAGRPADLARDAELYLLVPPATLAVFHLTPVVDALAWHQCELLLVRLHAQRPRGYREQIVTDDAGRFVDFRRHYGSGPTRLVRVAVTPEAEIARQWQHAGDHRGGWVRLRREAPTPRHAVVSIQGQAYDAPHGPDRMRFARDLARLWHRPDTTIAGVQALGPRVWADGGSLPEPSARLIGPLWIGAGRRLDAHATVAGPAVLWDDPAARPAPPPLRWPPRGGVEVAPVFGPESGAAAAPAGARDGGAGRAPADRRPGKRLFDIVFAAAALLVTLPTLFPIIMLAIWLEDGRPLIFSHRRQTLGGRPFPCLKFRSMRRDAERIKAQLIACNQADGPQFYIRDDPRLTRVGRLMRRFNLDELPQFLNVLVGQMSVVGPRPSPHEENQYCPAWREARLSVRPGITGLWQVRRSRAAGRDFQEWIKYDITYVENRSWKLDVVILAQTVAQMLGMRKHGS
ncbi:MAG: sugar transferase [Phycisphaeraceae bacterium]